jgi:thiamine kinase-like enzyme
MTTENIDKAGEIAGIAAEFAQNGQTIIDIVPFGGGHINDTYKIVTEGDGTKEYILLQRINHLVFKDPEAVMKNIERITEHLFKINYQRKILYPIQGKYGFLSRDFSGNYWRAYPFFDQTLTFQKTDTPELAYKAAFGFGEYISALSSLHHYHLTATIPDFHNGLLRLQQFKSTLENAPPDRLFLAKSEVAEALKYSSLFSEVDSLPLPMRIMHHDAKINNLLFDGNTMELLCVVDLDTVMPGIVLSDFGDMVRSSASSTEEDSPDDNGTMLNKSIYDAIKLGYLDSSCHILSRVEIEHLETGAKWMTLMQVLRFLSDYLQNDIYYKVQYPEHNLVRTRNQLTLFRSMLAQL